MLRPTFHRLPTILRTSLSTVAAQQTQEIPYSAGLPILGTGLNIKKAGGPLKFHEYVDGRHKEMGPIFKEHVGSFNKFVFISDPSLMRQVFSVEGKHPEHVVPKGWALYNKIHNCNRGLFFMEGEEWYKYRKLVNKSFLAPDVVSSLKSVHERLTKNFIQRWKKYDGQEVPDLAPAFYTHSISFALASLIGDSFWNKRELYESYAGKIGAESVHIFEYSSKLEALPSAKLAQLLRLPVWTNFEASVTASLDLSRKVVSEALKDLSPNGLLYKLVKENIPEETIYGIVDDLLLGAGDTTSYTSLWATYFLGKNKQVQEKVRRDPSLVKGVIKETLRLCPPAIFVTRIIPEETHIGGYRVDKGEVVLLTLYSCGHNERVYPSAETFLPERWTKIPGNVGYQGVTQTAGYLPFAMGVRSCVGVRLAQAQLNLSVNEILRNFELTTLEDVDMVLKFVPVPSKPVKVQIKSL